MFLKLSRSRNMTATELCPHWARVSACCTRSRNRFRLASSVSGSWKASLRSCSSSALRSLMSRKLSERKRSEEHTSELQSHSDLVCRLLLEKKKKFEEGVSDQNIACVCVRVARLVSWL